MKNMKKKTYQQGLIRAIIIIVVVIIIISYFGINLRDVANDPNTQGNFQFVKELIVNIWENILRDPAIWIWENIIRPAFDILRPFVEQLLDILRRGSV